MLFYFKSIPKGYRHFTLYIIHFPFSIIPIYATEGSDKSEFGRVVVTEWAMFNGGPLLRDPPSYWVILFGAQI